MKIAPVVSIVVLGVACMKSQPPSDKGAAPGAAAPGSAAPGGAAPGTPAAPGSAAPSAAPQNPLRALEQMQQAANTLGGKPGAVKAVNWRELMPILVDQAADWKATGEGKGESSAMGALQVTSVRRSYKKGEVTAELEIVDTSVSPALAAGYKLARSVTKDSSDEYMRPIDVGGQPAVEEWRASGKHGEVSVLVGDRFLLKVSASNVADTKDLVALVAKLDFGKLAKTGK